DETIAFLPDDNVVEVAREVIKRKLPFRVAIAFSDLCATSFQPHQNPHRRRTLSGNPQLANKGRRGGLLLSRSQSACEEAHNDKQESLEETMYCREALGLAHQSTS